MAFLKIGITGGIGSGKSTICKIFQQLNVSIYDADTWAKFLMTNDEKLILQLKKTFGSEIYDSKKKLNRALLAQKVFNNPIALAKLNALVHPALALHFEEWISNKKSEKYILKEAALLFETNAHKKLDQIITVFAPKEIRIERVKKRNQMSRKAILARMEKQMPETEKIQKADFVLYNDGSQMLIPQVLKLHKIFTS